jgi:hypothetical protein
VGEGGFTSLTVFDLFVTIGAAGAGAAGLLSMVDETVPVEEKGAVLAGALPGFNGSNNEGEVMYPIDKLSSCSNNNKRHDTSMLVVVNTKSSRFADQTS